MTVLYVNPGYVESGYIQTGITIYWGSRVIFVPKSSTRLIQLLPTEIRELDINLFRLELKSLEDDPDGMAFPITHNHNTSVTLGGLTYAHTIELINNYTVTFEDGQYAVNLVGANSNIADRVNVNQVSIRASNSAGLIEVSTMGGGSGPSAAEIALAIWNEPAINHTASGTTGLLLNQVKADTNAISIGQYTLQVLLNTILKYERNRTRIDLLNNTLTIYDDDGSTPLTTFNLKDQLGNPSISEVSERVPI